MNAVAALLSPSCDVPQKENKLRVLVRSVYEAETTNFVSRCDCDMEMVRKSIPGWSKFNPVLIHFPTGAGKTTLVYQELVARACAADRNLLLVTNRRALFAQQEKDILEHLSGLNHPTYYAGNGAPRGGMFDHVRIVTYQRLHGFINDSENRKWMNQMLYAVFDEAHYFTADALFNPYTELSLKAAVSLRNVIRVYMTATPWDVIVPLAKEEEKLMWEEKKKQGHAAMATGVWPYNSNEPSERGLLHFRGERDYKQYQLHFIKNLEVVKGIQCKKCLIFADSKKEGMQLRDELNAREQKVATYLDADSKGAPEWNQLVETERFESRHLIATSALDCGINIKDEAVDAVVVSALDRVTFLQEIGRKRLDRSKPEGYVTVYAVLPSRAKINRRCAELAEAIEFCESVKPGMLSANLSNRLLRATNLQRNLFYTVDGDAQPKLKSNELAWWKLNRDHHFLRKLQENGPAAYVAEVENWLEKPRGFSDGPRTPVEKLQNYLAEHVG